MSTRVVLFLCVILVSNSPAQTIYVENLQQLSWQYRLILLNGDALQASDLANLTAQKQALEERHIVWFWREKDQISSNASLSLSEQSKQQIIQLLQDVNVVLIGKDGAIKDKTNVFILASLFSTIDKMPMRRQEMQNMSVTH